VTDADLVRVDVSEGVGTLTLNRPQRHNAINDEMFEQYAAAQHQVLSDPAVRVVLIRGEGRSFCSGRDTSQLGRRVDGENDLDFIRRHQQPRLAALDAPKPIVAAVQGYAFGGGFEMALAADLRVAADDAVFALPEIGFALLPDTGGTQVLTALAGPARTKYLVMTGARIDAAQALAWGIVDFVVPRAELDDHARELCLRMADKSPTALALGKQLVDQAWAGAIRSGFAQELVAQTALFASAEYRAAKSEREA
jgi:enoyl-CoA hydratase/carnithine racemase